MPSLCILEMSFVRLSPSLAAAPLRPPMIQLVEQLRLVLAEVQMATVRNQVLLSMFTDFENYSVFKPDARHEKSVNEMFDQVIAWGGALKALREK